MAGKAGEGRSFTHEHILHTITLHSHTHPQPRFVPFLCTTAPLTCASCAPIHSTHVLYAAPSPLSLPPDLNRLQSRACSRGSTHVHVLRDHAREDAQRRGVRQQKANKRRPHAPPDKHHAAEARSVRRRRCVVHRVCVRRTPAKTDAAAAAAAAGRPTAELLCWAEVAVAVFPIVKKDCLR
eukprot:364324-Chlamydomonas_euryale.AAC.7